MGAFFIDTETGHIATQHQLIAAGLAPPDLPPSRPWFRIQGTGDATTLWYAVMRKHTRGIFIGTLTIRHGENHASLLGKGWEEVPVAEIGADLPDTAADRGG